ncbi:hypothetical protein [Corynebacterium tuberculostearicum]|nr:hypothetical protein [Corynebacterium tuberculostearicum]
MVVAFVLVLFALISVFTDGWGADFEWTYSKVAIIVAAVIVGAFSTMSKSQAGSRAQVAALVIAIVFIAASRFLPANILFTQPQFWVVFYAGFAVLCALVLKRSAMSQT